MSNPPVVKICNACGKDVTQLKRIKDPSGRYYCEDCYPRDMVIPNAPTTLARKPAQPVASSPAPVAPASDPQISPPPPPAAPSADHDLYDITPAPTDTRPKRAAPAVTAPAVPVSSAPPKKLDKCPVCGTPALTSARFCIGCRRDLTQMDKILELRAQGDKGPEFEKPAKVIGSIVKTSLIILGVIAFIFIVYGIYLTVNPGGPFDSYPTTREEAIRQFFTQIAKGTDKGYDNAYLLISQRERMTNTATDDERRFLLAFKKMHQDFEKKYGSNWLSRMKIERVGPDEYSYDDETIYNIVLDKDKYLLTTQVQISITQAVAKRMVIVRPPEVPENGKNHFAVVYIKDYPALEHRAQGSMLPPEDAPANR